MDNVFGQRVSVALIRKGLSQKQLAEKVGISLASMSRYISGERTPNPDILKSIALELNETSDYLLGIENNEFDLPKVKNILSRNANKLTDKQKKELIDALFPEEQ